MRRVKSHRNPRSGIPVANAPRHVHTGVMHRDLKPAKSGVGTRVLRGQTVVFARAAPYYSLRIAELSPVLPPAAKGRHDCPFGLILSAGADYYPLACGPGLRHNPLTFTVTCQKDPLMAMQDQPVDDVFHPGGKIRQDLLLDATLNVLREALRYARSTCWDSVRSPHLFMGLLAAPDPGVNYWGDKLGADLPRLLEQFAELFHQDEAEAEHSLTLHREFLSDNVIRLLREALGRARDAHRQCITPIDLLVSLFTTPNSIVAECFEKIGVTAAKLTELAVIAEQHISKRGPAPA
jgi:hypothetical protein